MRISSTVALQAPLSAPTLLRGNLCEGVRRSAALGFDGVELQFNAELNGMPDADRIVRVCEETGVVVCALATGSLYTKDGLSLISLDDSVVEETLARLRLYVDFSSKVGGKVIIGCVRGNLDDKKAAEII